jgi:hypothetical protein
MRRRTFLVMGAAIAVSLALASTVVTVTVREQLRQAVVEAEAEGPIDGIEEYADLPREHVDEPAAYEQKRPAGGNHAPVWTNCGVYTDPVNPEQSVLSLEHAGVWATYQPGLAQEQVHTLTAVAAKDQHTLLSPFEDLQSPVVASAWGTQLALDSMAGPRDLERFEQSWGEDAERLFLQLTIPHHQGGVAKADVAENQAFEPQVRRLAQTIVDFQTVEPTVPRDMLEVRGGPAPGA